MMLGEYLRFAEEVYQFLPKLEGQEMPIEAELHAAMVRNKLEILLPHLRRIVELYPQMTYHYDKIFECMDEGGERGDFGQVGK